jgi:hypothetical protein
MAGIKISALPAVASALITDYMPVVQAGVTSRETLQQISTLFGFDSGTGLLALNKGGTNASLTAALGAVPYSTASAFAFLAPGTTGQLFRSGGAGAPTWTTSTYPATNAINTLLYASSANVMAALATGNSSVLVTSAGGVPSLSTVLPGGLTTTDPVLTQGIATKNYVDQTALTGTTVYASSAASLGTVTQSGAGVGATLTNAGVQATFALDGVNPPAGTNVLIQNTAVGMTSANEGIYTVTSVGSGATNWVLTRATTYDTPAEINTTGLIVVQNGSTLVGTAWYNSTTSVTVDTTALTFVEFGNIVFPITLAHGGTSAALTASNGGIFYSTATAGAILSGTATAQQLLMSGSSTAPIWSTSTYPTTNAINTLLYASSANVMAALATVNSAGLLTSAGGVPGWVAYTGTGAPVLATSPTLVTPILGVAAATSIALGGGTALANYLQGTFTPTLTGSVANPTTITYAQNTGEYTRIGNTIHWSVFISVATLTIGAASGNLQITGLPVAAGGGNTATGSIVAGALTYTGTQLTAAIVSGNTFANIYQFSSTLNIGVVPITGLSATTIINASGSYFTS